MTNLQIFTILRALGYIIRNLPGPTTTKAKLERKEILHGLTQAARPTANGVNREAKDAETERGAAAAPAGPAPQPVLAINEAPLPSSMPSVRPGTVAGAPVMTHNVEVAND